MIPLSKDDVFIESMRKLVQDYLSIVKFKLTFFKQLSQTNLIFNINSIYMI